MPCAAYDHVQLSSIKTAADRMGDFLKAEREKDRLVVMRAVFDIAAESGVFDTDQLVEMALEQLTPRMGWRFSQDEPRENETQRLA